MSLRNNWAFFSTNGDIQCFNNAAKSVLGWSVNLPQFQIFFFCCTVNNTTLYPRRSITHNCWPHSTHPARVRACILEQSIKTTYRRPKGTAYHLKISCRPYNTGIIWFCTVKSSQNSLSRNSYAGQLYSDLDCVYNQVSYYQKLVHAQISQ